VINLVFTTSYQRLAQTGAMIKTALLGVLLVIVLVAVAAFFSSKDVGTSVQFTTSFPLFKWLFTPARWCAGLMLAPLTGVTNTDWQQLGIIWLAAAIMFVILVSRRENIYEPALQPSAAYHARRMAAMSGDQETMRANVLAEKRAKRAGLSVKPFGTGWSAVLWKNLQVKVRVRGWRLILELAAPWLLAYAVSATQDKQEVIQYTPLCIPYMAAMLAMTVQPEVRSEIKHSNMTKCMPIEPWKVVIAYIITSLSYTVVFVVSLCAAVLIFLPGVDVALLVACSVFTLFFAFAVIPPLYIGALFYPNIRDFVQNFLSVIIGLLFAGIAVSPTVALLLVNYVMFGLGVWPMTALLCVVNLIIGLGGAIVAGQVYDSFDPGVE